MKAAFTAFAATICLLMGASALAGLNIGDDAAFSRHFALGLMTTLFTCLCHCVVLAYFMATSKMMRLAVEDAGLDLSLADAAQRLKSRATVTLMPAIALALLAAVTGGWATVNPIRARTHLVLIILSSVVQLAAFYREYGLIHENGRHMDRVFALHAQAQALRPAVSSPDV